MLKNRKVIRIEWGDCDAAGVVFYPRYLAYFDACTHALFERAGCRQRDMQNRYQILGFPLAEIRARFIVPCSYDEDIVVETCVTEFRRSSFEVQHRLYKGDALAAEAFETRVCVARPAGDTQKLEAKPIPLKFVKCLSDPES
jgi:4-hydroxybenzoyl-CoA thioesterase